MDPIMMGIAAVVILVLLAGVFFIKKSKTNAASTSQRNVKRPKTLAEQQRELELQRQSQQPMPTTTNSLPQSALQTAQTINTTQSGTHSELQAAEQLIQAQDYEGAITILRRAVKNYPTHNNLHFALLNTYALAKDYQNFNAFYPDVLALNDVNLTIQANNLKSLVDEEHAASLAASTMVKAENAQADGLDFELFDMHQAANKPTETHALATASTPAVSQVAATTSQVANKTDNASDFDFSLNALETQSAMPVTNTNKSIVAKATADELSFDEIDFDLPNDEVATFKKKTISHTEIFAPISTAPAESVESPAIAADSDFNFDSEFNFESDFDFDFKLTTTQSKPVAPAIPTLQPVVDTAATTPADKTITDDGLDFDFELDSDLDAEPATAAVATTTTHLITKKSPDIDVTLASLDNQDLPQPSSDPLTMFNSVTNVSTAINDADLTSFNLDDELWPQADATANSAPITTAATKPVTTKPNAQTSIPSNSLKISDEMFDFGLDDEAVKPHSSTTSITDAQPAATDDKIDWSFNEPATTQTATSAATPIEADTPHFTAAPVIEDLSAVFEVVKNIDTDALNVDLAEQYVNLGEYDSAKRLLDEIKDSDNAALLARADALRQRIA